MSRFYSVSIPVKPHIEKFFRAREGHPIRSSDQSMIWIILRPYLIYKRSDGYSVRQRHQQIQKLKGSLRIELPINKVKLYGLEAKPASVILLNRVLDHYFARELYWHVKACESVPSRYKGFKTAIETFCGIYNIDIEVDINLDALLKAYQRQRSIEQRIFGAKKISSPFAAA